MKATSSWVGFAEPSFVNCSVSLTFCRYSPPVFEKYRQDYMLYLREPRTIRTDRRSVDLSSNIRSRPEEVVRTRS